MGRAELIPDYIENLQARVENVATNTLISTGVRSLINQIAEPTAEEEEESGDMTLGLWSQDESVGVDVQLEINQADQTHEWEVTFFLPSLIEGDCVVSASLSTYYDRPNAIYHSEMTEVKSWLERECDRIYHHIEWNEEKNRQNYRDDRQRRREIEAKKKREAEETAWIENEVRLADPLVGSF